MAVQENMSSRAQTLCFDIVLLSFDETPRAQEQPAEAALCSLVLS